MITTPNSVFISMKKKKIMEILDSNEVIIGSDDKPQVDPNAASQATGTTDKNAKIGHQPFDDKFWGTFGFSLYEEDELIKIAEDVIGKRTDKSMNNKKEDKSELITNKVEKIKELFADLSDSEKGDIVKKFKK
jgi:hypothetical protein